jgi:hypothetical protein
MADQNPTGVKKVAGILAIVLVFVALTALLMPTLRSAKVASLRKSLEWEYTDRTVDTLTGEPSPVSGGGEPMPALAKVHAYVADIELHPRLSVGTKRPEPIYQAAFHASIKATRTDDAPGPSAVRLPLPPQLISLADLEVTVNGDPSDSVRWAGRYLLWEGSLDNTTPDDIEVRYMAVGKGVFQIEPPPGAHIIDRFETHLVAEQSDVRMLELSLQPQTYEKQAGKVVCDWTYDRLLVGQPIRLDVLGIAPLDRLAELVWLGPVSVLVFGVLFAVSGLACHPEKLDKWMLLLIVGAFAGGYPLMYFAQDFLPLAWAVFASAGLVLLVIAVRSLTLLGPAAALAAVAMAAGTQALTIGSAVYDNLQGVLLTVLGLVTLAVTMSLLPRAQRKLQAMSRPPEPPMPVEPEGQAD